MTQEIVKQEGMTALIEQVVIGGDLSRLTPEQRVNYYNSVCTSLGLNPLTKPFDYITLNGKLTLYARKDCADQLRASRGVSISKLEREKLDGIYTVTAYATDKAGRQDSSIGAVNIENLKGDALANAIMKAETKAKRRVTLSLCGLGMLDETEIETVRTAHPVVVDTATGEIIPPAQPPSLRMSLESASAVTTHAGEQYGSLDDDALRKMRDTITRKLDKDPGNEDLQYRADAITVILNSRA